MVFIPGISTLERRKGGGGGGRGGGAVSGGARGGSGGSSVGGGGGGRTSSISSGGSSRSSSSTSFGGGRVTTIPPGQLFSGRQQGGGTRNNVYGTSVYGSGYPGVVGAGVAGRSFPFYYWPVIWGTTASLGTARYLHSDGEYGDAHNTSRPGGPLATAALPSSTNGNSTFRLMSDNATMVSLLADIVTSCGSSISSASSIIPAPYNDSGPPTPEQAIQYYRASSIVLSLDSYNNSAVYSNDTSAPPSPLPSNVDQTLLTCLNNTIGTSAPLVNGAIGWSSPSGLSLFVLVWAISRLISQI